MTTTDPTEQRRRIREGLCLACAQPLPDDASARRMYCDPRCGYAHRHAQARAKAGDTRAGTCQHCGAAFTEPHKRGPVSAYCSPRCQGKARHKREYQPRARQRGQRYKHKAGATFGQLTITERLDDSALAVASCACGTTGKLVHVRNLVSGLTTHCAGPAHRARTETPSYSGAHGRVRAARGPASAHSCILCGKRQAKDWAYRHGDLDQLTEATGREAGAPYSTDPAQYWPVCRPCHQRWDEAQRRQAPGGGLSLAHVALAMAVTPEV